LARAELAELAADEFGGGEDHCVDLGAGLDAGLHRPFRATRRTRIISTWASRDFGVPLAFPD
jgi:hypothetical protein